MATGSAGPVLRRRGRQVIDEPVAKCVQCAARLRFAIRRAHEQVNTSASAPSLAVSLRCPPFPDRDPIGFSWKGTGTSAGKKMKRYTPEFKQQAVRKVVDNSQAIAQVARELGVTTPLSAFG